MEVEVEEVLEIRESTLGRPDLGSWVGGLPSGGSLLSETLLELEGEREREEDLSRETSDFGLGFLSRRKKPVKRLSLDEPAGECESAGGWSTSGTER
jgi:hypothetical protein